MHIPSSYSTLSSDALLQMAIENYGLPAESSITFLKRGWNDTYRIDTGHELYILRVYKYGWRSLESIHTEITLLQYLENNGLSVSYPIPDKQHGFIQNIVAAEGERYAVMFSFAEGEQVRKLNKEQAKMLGEETARMHQLTTGKDEGETAQDYGIERQFEKTLNTLKPVLKDHPEAFDYLLSLQKDFMETFGKADPSQLSKGICHGDLQAENFHINAENEFTFFDFDFFGKGYLAYDIGIFIWYDHKNKPKEIVDAFLEGYQLIRKLTETELRLLPYFSTLRALFQMTLYCEISDGKQLPLWPAGQVAEFVGKVKKWHSGNAPSHPSSRA